MHNYNFNEIYEYPLFGFGSGQIPERPCTLRTDLRGLLYLPEFNDVIFSFPKELNEKQVPKEMGTQSNIVYARCPRLWKLISKKAKQPESGRTIVKIKDIKYDLFGRVLHYLHTSHIDLLPSSKLVQGPSSGVIENGKESSVDHISIELLKASDILDLDHLKSLCETQLQKSANKSNAIEMLQLGDDYNAYDLKDYCIQLIANSPELYETAKKTLSKELLQQVKRSVPVTRPHVSTPL